MNSNETYEEGYDAYWEGVDVSDNPYDQDENAEEFASWIRGWRKAREHDYDESDG